MILFPNAKINIGLRVLRRRPDGYHDLAGIFVPISWCDVLEIVWAPKPDFRQIGLSLDCPAKDNIVLKALKALENHLGQALPPLDITLEKHIPSGAGLGGGSADAAFTLCGVNELLGLGLDKATLAAIAATVGADCPFFIYNTPMLAQGIGDILTPADASALKGHHLLVVKDKDLSVSTARAYAGIQPSESVTGEALLHHLSEPVDHWRDSGVLTNDFESTVFTALPAIGLLKDRMLKAGATYAAMSGSGSAVFGIFPSADSAMEARRQFKELHTHIQRLD